MFVPGVQQGVHLRVPRRAVTFAFACLTVVTVLAAWAASPTPHASDGAYGAGFVPSAPLTNLNSVALIIPDGPIDHLVFQKADVGAQRTFLTDFPSTFTLHARGMAAPRGESIAVLWVDGSPAASHLTLVATLTGKRIEAEGRYSYLSGLAWTPSGDGVAALTANQRDGAGRVNATIVRVQAATGQAETLGAFNAVFEAHPVGYTPDGERLYVVVVDESGSALWSIQQGKVQRGTQLSAGRTRDWQLSPAASRLAFSEDYGVAGAQRSAGRVLNLMTGVITAAGRDGVQFSPTWRGDSATPLFGGPEGDLQLQGAEQRAYLAPHGWASDGSLVATVHSADGAAPSLQVVRSDVRFVLAEEAGASFLGFVPDFN